MCGRYAASRSVEDLRVEFELDVVPERALAPDWNVAPTKEVYAVIARRQPGTEPGADPDSKVRRELLIARWGLVPSWAKDASIGQRLINARAETVEVKPAFRRAFARRRCLVPADGYYEWYVPQQGSPGRGVRPLKQPFLIHRADGGVLAMAGLYEIWRDPSRHRDDSEHWLTTVTVITTAAEESIGQIHDRMPLLIEREGWTRWLDPSWDGSTGDLRELLAPPAQGQLEAYPVTTAVNSVRNNGPELLLPIKAEAEEQNPSSLF